MAMFDKPMMNGIQLGKKLDICMTCTRENKKGEYGLLEYKEVFKMHLNGLEYVLCMEHFQEILGDYVLVHKDSLTEEDTIEVDMEKLESMNEADAQKYIEQQAVSNKKGKK
jgi:hypothetical protein